MNCHATGRGETDQFRTLPLKMLKPTVAARVKQWNCLPANSIEARDVRPLVMVARIARQREILFQGRPLMLLRDDMIDLKSEPIKRLWHLTVLARAARARPNQLLKRLFHAMVRT